MASLLRGPSILQLRRQPARGGNGAVSAFARTFLSQDMFAHTLFVERKRTERSGRAFVLMLMECTKLLRDTSDENALERVLLALSGSTRDTDIKGWHKEGSAIGVIFTELGPDVEGRCVAQALLNKVTQALCGTLAIQQLNQIHLSFHVFPENWDKGKRMEDDESGLYDELHHDAAPTALPRIVKRTMDLTGSLLALTLGLPLMVVIAIAIKLTSKGPVLFRQPRLGQYGRTFDFLKFRSMYINNDATIHREFVKDFIMEGNGIQREEGGPAYKLAADPRVTPLGRFLRKTSLDELPQFLNVLKGEMSLVGPRPPVPYEVECYRVWHKARLLAAKPGITGLWQVAGRSRVKFDDMVRMDLRYANTWSVWLDLKILAQTPYAVFSGNGAQ